MFYVFFVGVARIWGVPDMAVWLLATMRAYAATLGSLHKKHRTIEQMNIINNLTSKR